MRLALAWATLYRQPFQVNGPSPFAARSRLMSACCVELTTIAGAAGPEPPVEAAGGAGGGGGGGVLIFRGIACWTVLAKSVPTDGCASCARDAVSTGWPMASRCTTEIPAPPRAATIANPPSQVKKRIADESEGARRRRCLSWVKACKSNRCGRCEQRIWRVHPLRSARYWGSRLF